MTTTTLRTVLYQVLQAFKELEAENKRLKDEHEKLKAKGKQR